MKNDGEMMRVGVLDKNGKDVMFFVHVSCMDATYYNMNLELSSVRGETCWVCTVEEMARFLRNRMEAEANSVPEKS